MAKRAILMVSLFCISCAGRVDSEDTDGAQTQGQETKARLVEKAFEENDDYLTVDPNCPPGSTHCTPGTGDTSAAPESVMLQGAARALDKIATGAQPLKERPWYSFPGKCSVSRVRYVAWSENEGVPALIFTLTKEAMGSTTEDDVVFLDTSYLKGSPQLGKFADRLKVSVAGTNPDIVKIKFNYQDMDSQQTKFAQLFNFKKWGVLTQEGIPLKLQAELIFDQKQEIVHYISYDEWNLNAFHRKWMICGEKP